MASTETWEKVERYFKPDSKIDNWGNPDKISDGILLRLYDFRDWLKVPIYVTSGVREGKDGSFHGSRKDQLGKEVGYCALDIVIPDYDESNFDLVLDATRFGFRGIGFYPHWRFNGYPVGGLHLDERPLKWDPDDTFNYAHNRWMGIMENGKQKYIALTFQNLLAHS